METLIRETILAAAHRIPRSAAVRTALALGILWMLWR